MFCSGAYYSRDLKLGTSSNVMPDMVLGSSNVVAQGAKFVTQKGLSDMCLTNNSVAGEHA